jgi:hypothetical protein
MESLVGDIPAGDGKTAKLFLQCKAWSRIVAKMYVLTFRTATKILFMYSFSGNSVASAPISTFMCLWRIYKVPGSVYIFPPAEYADWSWENINRSQTHECGNWDWDPNIPFLGIFFSKFRYSVFAMRTAWVNAVRPGCDKYVFQQLLLCSALLFHSITGDFNMSFSWSAYKIKPPRSNLSCQMGFKPVLPYNRPARYLRASQQIFMHVASRNGIFLNIGCSNCKVKDVDRPWQLRPWRVNVASPDSSVYMTKPIPWRINVDKQDYE